MNLYRSTVIFAYLALTITSAPVFNQVNHFDTRGNFCPLPTVMRLECSMVCVSDISLCPDIIKPNCPADQVYCVDGTCQSSCPDTVINPCMCGLSSGSVSGAIASLVPCLEFVARNVTSYNSTNPNVVKNSCIGYLGYTDLPTWNETLSEDAVYLKCPSALVPPLTYTEPTFIFFWTVISVQLSLFVLWTTYRNFEKSKTKDNTRVSSVIELTSYLQQNSMANKSTSTLNEDEKLSSIRPKEGSFGDDVNYKSQSSNSTQCLYIKGFKRSYFGLIALLNIHVTTLSCFTIVLLLCLDYYGFINGVGAGLTHGDFDYSGKLFIIVWSYMAAWVIILVVYKDQLNNYFRTETPLENAGFIQVVYNQPKLVLEAKNYSKITTFVLKIEELFQKYAASDKMIETCKVQTEESGVKYFVFNHSRFLYNESLHKFESKSFTYWDTNRSILALKDGLTSEQAFGRLQYAGPNFISVKVSSFPVGLFKEFMSFFYIYQFMVLWLFYYYNYWQVGLANTFVILFSATVKVIVKILSEKRLKGLAEFEDSVKVIRDGNLQSISTKNLVPGDVFILEPNKIAPCDAVLLTGEVILNESSLTGEALPTRKTHLKSSDMVYDKFTTGKNSTILSGTIIQQTSPTLSEHTLALVTGTGTSSEKGKMIQSILFPKRIQFIFDVQIKVAMAILAVQGIVWFGMILWLLKKSAVASWFSAVYALVEIISPILPAALVIGQTIAASNLKKLKIFCVDIPRIIVAGKIEVFCFDKTGTLTNEGLEYIGVSQLGGHGEHSDEFESSSQSLKLQPLTKSITEYNKLTMMGLATCHSVSRLKDELIGNPVDVEMFKKTGWVLGDRSEGSYPNIYPTKELTHIGGNDYNQLSIIKEFEFIHHRSRMSVCVKEEYTDEIHVFVKGSFEKIASISQPDSVPPEYYQHCESLAKQGCYVLALAHKNLGKIDPNTVKNWSVDMMESDVSLHAIMCFKNELKPDTADALKEISDSNTRIVMITGDTTLTGIHIAQQCGMIGQGKKVILGEVDKVSKSVVWTDASSENSILHVDDCILADPQVELAITGEAFNFLYDTEQIRKYLLNVRVFGRMTPHDKVTCINLHMEKGITAMCGDGGNDCGALRAAHCGIALSGSDASIVSPFSTTKKSIYSCVELMSQGRGAIATSFANYKFLILYGQIMAMFKAFSMYYSVTISQPVWVTVDGFISIAMSLSISLSKPLQKLSRKRPTAKLLGPQTLASTIGQTVLNWVYIIVLFIIMYQQSWYKCHEFDSSSSDYKKWWLLGDNYEAEILGLVVMMQFANCGFIYNFGYEFRQSWYKNYVLIIVWASFISVFSYIMLADPNWLGCRFRMNCGDKDVLANLGYKVPSFYIEPYNIPQGHNVIPKNFKWFLWGYCVSNMVLGILWEKLVVIGPLGRFIVRNWAGKKMKT